MKKILFRGFLFLLFLVVVAGITFAVAYYSSDTFATYMAHGAADIDDYTLFSSRTIDNDGDKFTFVKSDKELDLKHKISEGVYEPFSDFLEENKTNTFLVIRNDSIIYERYNDGFDRSSIVTSFSIAKSIVSLLVGCAIDDGLIQSVDDPITKYIPDLKANGMEEVTIKHLLQMTSGISFNESYVNPFGDAASLYYGHDIKEVIFDLKMNGQPGESFDYNSGNTQLLGYIIDQAVGAKSLSDYLDERIWEPLEMEFDATWSTDKEENGMEKAFCCINARAIDFAKIGRLYMNKGNWNGVQIVSPEWVEQSTKVDTSEGSREFYQYQWWLPGIDGDFVAKGILGQYLYVNPVKKLLVLRFGEEEDDDYWKKAFKVFARKYGHVDTEKITAAEN